MGLGGEVLNRWSRGTGERVINLVSVQLNWKDRGWGGSREKRRPSSTGLYSSVCASKGVALGGRSASWKRKGLKYGKVFHSRKWKSISGVFLYEVYATCSVGKTQHFCLRIPHS